MPTRLAPILLALTMAAAPLAAAQAEAAREACRVPLGLAQKLQRPDAAAMRRVSLVESLGTGRLALHCRGVTFGAGART